MTLRTRTLMAFGVVVAIPLALLALGLRLEMTNRLTEEYRVRVDTVVAVIKEDLQRESADISARLVSLKSALVTDNRFRLAAVAELESERNYCSTTQDRRCGLLVFRCCRSRMRMAVSSVPVTSETNMDAWRRG